MRHNRNEAVRTSRAQAALGPVLSAAITARTLEAIRVIAPEGDLCRPGLLASARCSALTMLS